MKLRVGDPVEVIRGADRGLQGPILAIDRSKNKVIVEGVNQVFKHVRPSQKNPQGGRLSKEMPISAANVMILCPQTNEPSKIGIRYLEDGTKERYAKVSGASLGTISPARARYAHTAESA
ncbi:KOW domain-containing protein [Planctomycetales bacterium 10988]|nr:KOW domain-containing protein [Planctomycetales bacterium 10988]